MIFSFHSGQARQTPSQLLLHEKIIIPTYDFGIIPIILEWVGYDLFKELFNNNSIEFIRRKGVLGYAGNGNGINKFEIHSQGKETDWKVEATFSENEKSLELQLSQLNLAQSRLNSLIDSVLSSTINLNYSNEFFIENIVNESYEDIINSKHLSNYVFLNSEKSEEQV